MSYQQWEDRRKYKRYSSDLQARFRKLDDDAAALQEGQVLNVSRGGVFLRTQSPFPVGTEILLLVNIVTPLGEERELESHAKVMWSGQNPGEEGMGLCFTKIDRHTQFAMLACAYRGEG